MLRMHRMWQNKRGGTTMIFTNQALALFPPALGQAIAHTQRDRQ